MAFGNANTLAFSGLVFLHFQGSDMRIFRLFIVSIIAGFLYGCAANNLAVQDAKGNTIEAPVSSFKLQNTRVVWLDNPDFNWELRSAIDGRNLQRVYITDPIAIARAKSDMLLMYKLLKDHGEAEVMASLATSNVRPGELQTIELHPALGYWSGAGWGSGVVLNVTITDHQTKRIWKHTVQADTGLQMVGAMAAAAQDRSYVRNFATGLQRIFSLAQLI